MIQRDLIDIYVMLISVLLLDETSQLPAQPR